MTGLVLLWLPILVSAVVVFVASSIIHMASPWHKNDYPPLPNEDEFRNAVGQLNIPVGDYMVPRPRSREELKDPAFIEKVKRGPNVIMTIMPGDMAMGRNLGLWFVYVLLMTIFAAYITGRALGPGADSGRILQLASTVAFIGYSAALWPMSIWYRRSWNITAKATIDGLIYAFITAAVMVWLWPKM
jgi:hypothetical protein